MLEDVHWSPLQQRRKQKRLLTFYKATNNLSPIIIPEYVKLSSGRTRTLDIAYVQLQTNYEQYKNSFLSRTIREWNSLPPDLVHSASVDDVTARPQSYTFWTVQPVMFLSVKYDVLTSCSRHLPVMLTPWAILN